MMEAVYLQYFGLSEAPFSITPDPTFIYLSQRHRDALAHLMYGVGQGGSGGFVQLTGEVGTGKTTLCRCVLEQVPEGTRIALILNPLMSPREMLESICDELGVEAYPEDTNKQIVDRLNVFLLDAHAAGERVVVVIDEAQNLNPESLEQIRLLTNLETHKHKLMQIVLLGQPELRDLLQRRSLRQLAQRITARFHLTPLSRADTARYVQHRMQVAGAERNPFRPGALRALYQRSGGIPRLINIIADRALLAAYATERMQVDAALVHAAADEVQKGESGVQRGGALRRRWIPAAAVIALAAVALWAWQARDGGDDPVTVSEIAETMETAQQPPDEPEPTLPDSLDEAWLETQHHSGWRSLATLWGEPAAAGDIMRSCETTAARASGSAYACLLEEGNWALIRRLDLPVLIVLQSDRQRLLLLRGMQDDALLVGADEPITVSREAVESQWLGQFLVAWPQPEGWPSQLRMGNEGPAVDIVLEMAGQAEPPYRGARQFDLAFENWLREFQQRNGLESDGIVGPNTLLRLMAPTLAEPSLLKEWPLQSAEARRLAGEG